MNPIEFRNVVDTHRRMVFSIALRITGDWGTAEEVAQDTFVDLFRCSQTLTGVDHLRFWLRRTAVHRATDAWRKRLRRPESVAGPWIEEQHGAESVAQPHPEVGGGLHERLSEILQALPDELRIALVLRYQEEMTPPEIAALLDQPLATVKSHLQRGLELLRKKAAVTMKEYVR